MRRDPPDAAAVARGAACTRERPCAAGLECMTGHYAFGGYCASPCGAACDGACVGTPRGETCMAKCARDADCRASEGYVCDATWKACMMPNSASIAVRTCDAPRGIGRNPAFAPTTALFDAHQTSATLVDGRIVALPDKSIAFAKGTYFAAWTNSFATSKDGTTWSQPTALEDCEDCRVVSGTDIHVLDAHHGLRVRTSRDGGKTFGTPVTALSGGRGNVTIDASGRMHAVALDGNAFGAYGSANQRIHYAVSADGARSFTRPITVSQRDEILPFYFANPSIAVDTRRKWIYIAYVRGGRDAIWDIVLVASKDGGQTWTRTALGDGCAIHMVPNLALDATTGTLHVAWYDARGLRFAHATCGIGLAKCTQVGRINDVPFATLSTVRGNATWVGDYETLVVDEKRRELHAVWAQPIDEAGKITTRVFHAKAKLPLR